MPKGSSSPEYMDILFTPERGFEPRIYGFELNPKEFKRTIFTAKSKGRGCPDGAEPINFCSE